MRGNVLFPNPSDQEVDSLEELYVRRCYTRHNIDKHLPLLRHLGSLCETITELGSDIGFSTTAFLASKPKRLTCIDVCIRPELLDVVRWAPKGTKVNLIEDSSLNVTIDDCDLLLIDTLHTYNQVAGELTLHGDKARKFIVLHDIVSFPEIVPAIREYLDCHPEWIVKEWSTIQSGMAVLERREPAIIASHTQGTEPDFSEEAPVTMFELDVEVSPS
jgi:hypothetical protein